MKTQENDRRALVRRLHEGVGDRAVVWIDHGTGRVMDELEVETRIRTGTEGCQLCHEALDGREAHGALEFDDQGLPRLLLGPGGPICSDCREWLRWVDHYAGREAVSTPRFGAGDFAVRARTEEIYRVLEASLTGLPAAGIWFPTYRCQKIEIGRASGKILPACLGLEFEFADFELQPVPPRYPIAASRSVPIQSRPSSVDLVGTTPPLPMIEHSPSNGQTPRIAQETRRLLPGKGGGP